MRKLKESNLIDPLNDKVLKEKVPILGICLGAELFGNMSEEKGLAWLDVDIVKFDRIQLPKEMKIPHMSWNSTKI
jgi:imidazole glycerol-phosphate synthase subunit HisH